MKLLQFTSAFLLICTLQRYQVNGGFSDDRKQFAAALEELKDEIKGRFQNQENENPRDDESDDDDNMVMDMELENDDSAAEQSSYTYAAQYDNQVIYIESIRRRGRWLDASYKKSWVYFQQVHQDDVVDHLGVKWLVTDVGGGAVVLESMRYKRHYLDAHHSGWCKVTYSSYPQGQNWAKFKIEKASNGHFYFRSVRYSNKRLDEYEGYYLNKYYGALTTGKGNYAQFRIYVPPKSDYYGEVATLDNSDGTKEREFTYEEKKGISMTHGREISNTISTEIGVEIKKAFSFGLSFSTTWKTFHQTTYSKMVTYSVKTTVSPGYILYVKQLKGTYGHFVVHANKFKFVDVKAKKNKKVVFASGIDEYNRGKFNRKGFEGHFEDSMKVLEAHH